MDQPWPSRWLGCSETARDLKPLSQRIKGNDSRLVSGGKKVLAVARQERPPSTPRRILSSFVTRHASSRVGSVPASCCSAGPDSDLPSDAFDSLTSAHFLLPFPLARAGSCFNWALCSRSSSSIHPYLECTLIFMICSSMGITRFHIFCRGKLIAHLYRLLASR